MFKKLFKKRNGQPTIPRKIKIINPRNARQEPQQEKDPFKDIVDDIVNVSMLPPRDASIIFGGRPTDIHSNIQPKIKKRLDWLDDLEKRNKEYKSAKELKYDICCFPLLPVTFNSFKSKK